MQTNKAKQQKQLTTISAFAVIALSSFLYLACSDDSNVVKENPVPDAGSTTSSGGSSGTSSSSGDGGNGSSSGDAGPTDCVQNPTTHLDIINACTTAQRITKNPTLNKLLADGGLPPVQ